MERTRDPQDRPRTLSWVQGSGNAAAGSEAREVEGAVGKEQGPSKG